MKPALKRAVRMLMALLLTIPVLLVLAGQLGFLAGEPPQDLGVRDGRLKPPAFTPNSVSSQADLYPEHPQRSQARIEALRYSGDGQAALARLATHLGTQPRVQVVTREATYVYAQCSTRWLGFTDDLELWLDLQAGVIQVRSASRLGDSDLGMNRARVEALRAVLAP